MVRILLTLFVASAGCLVMTGAAQAGGPTSALLVSPGAERSAAVYYSDAEYQRLTTLLGGDSPGRDPAASTGPPAGGDYITVTWLIHDVSVWRIDRIFLGAADGPWIVTQLVVDQAAGGMYPGEAGDDSAVLHRSPDPAALQDLLASLGLAGPATGRAAGAAASIEPAQVESAQVERAQVESAQVAARSGSAWWWALAGLAAGVVLTALAVRFLPAARTRLTERTMAERTVADQPAVDDGLVQMTPLSG
jgi:hypothetical protein